MKISGIETIRIAARPSIIWVRVGTDEGLVGLGETWFGAGAVEADIHERIAPLIIGRDATDIAGLAQLMKPYVGFCGTGVEMRALSAVEVALWDIAGKAAGLPLAEVLGGAVHSSVPVYNTCAGPSYVSNASDVRPGNFGLPGADGTRRYEDLDAFLNRPAELAADLLEMGVESMKIWPFDFAADAGEGEISATDLAKALKPFEAIRATHGDRIRIKAELHGIWTLEAARRICRALEPLAVDWVEDAVNMDRFDDLGALADGTSLPLSGGETLGGLAQIEELITRGKVAVPIVDVVWGGGIGFAMDAAALAASHRRPIAFHDCSGPVTLAVSTHLAMACPNAEEQEITRAFYYGWYDQAVTGLPVISNGMISVSSEPGHGIALTPTLRAGEAVTRTSGRLPLG